jgi:hypothetical protein
LADDLWLGRELAAWGRWKLAPALELWIVAEPLDEPVRWTASRRPELLLRARPALVALLERLAQRRVLRPPAREFSLRRQVRAQEEQQLAALPREELRARLPAQVLQRLERLLRARGALLSRRLPSRLFLKLRRLRRQLRLSLNPENVF